MISRRAYIALNKVIIPTRLACYEPLASPSVQNRYVKLSEHIEPACFEYALI